MSPINFFVQLLTDFPLKKFKILTHKQKVDYFHFMIRTNHLKIKAFPVFLGNINLLIRKIMDFYQLTRRKLNLSKTMRIFLDQGSMK